MRTHFLDQRHKGRDGVSLDIEFSREDFLQLSYVLIADVSLVRAGMYRDSLRSEALTIQSDLQEVGDVSASCITQRSYLIYIDA